MHSAVNSYLSRTFSLHGCCCCLLLFGTHALLSAFADSHLSLSKKIPARPLAQTSRWRACAASQDQAPSPTDPPSALRTAANSWLQGQAPPPTADCKLQWCCHLWQHLERKSTKKMKVVAEKAWVDTIWSPPKNRVRFILKCTPRYPPTRLQMTFASGDKTLST